MVDCRVRIRCDALASKYDVVAMGDDPLFDMQVCLKSC